MLSEVEAVDDDDDEEEDAQEEGLVGIVRVGRRERMRQISGEGGIW